MNDVTTMDLLARLETLTTRLDRLEAENAGLRARLGAAQMPQAPRAGDGRRPSVETGPGRPPAPEATTRRRALLRGLIAAGGAIGALAAAKARTAEAGARSLFIGSSGTTDYGMLVSAPVSDDPANDLPSLNGTLHVLIATSGTTAKSPDKNSSVLGLSSGAAGVQGQSNVAEGVYGASLFGIGVSGLSTNNYGVQGATLKTGFAGLVGVGTVAGSAGFYALGTNGATAGTFEGDVVVNGSLTVTGSFPKSAAVKKRDGTQVRMYCQESPEPWFEDFGTATLANGQAIVNLDPEFDEVVRGDDYRVFLTPIGVECRTLYVARKAPHRFEVRSHAGSAASGSFDYRVVARRRDDVGKRLERVDIPTMAPIDVERLTRPAQ
jgi:hypothetical protein